MLIKKIEAIQIIDSRGNPTVEATIFSENDNASASVPSGASVGSKESYELRDFDSEIYNGKSVYSAVENINSELNYKISGINFESQESFDKALIDIDGTENKKRLGSNAILALSFAFARLLAKSKNKELFENILNNSKINKNSGISENQNERDGSSNEYSFPVPMMNIINGGVHADNGLDFQEFMIMPVKGESFSEALMAGVNVYHKLKKNLKSKNLSTNVGDEGGFAPNISSTQEAIELIIASIEECGYVAGEDILISIDCAASEFYINDRKQYLISNKNYSCDELINLYESLINKYPIFSIEDPISEYDEEGFVKMTKSLGDKVQIVGDDFFVTNAFFIKNGVKNGACNSVLIKPNQIGTLTETFESIQISHTSNYSTIMSHRSGETEDNIISHLAIGSKCEQVKFGAPCRSDRNSKYNELLRIENYLNRKNINFTYLGKKILNKFKTYKNE